jgi:tetratricopeptide (TPR) repeat protein
LPQPAYALCSFYLALNAVFSVPSCSFDSVPRIAEGSAATVTVSSNRERAIQLFDRAVAMALKLESSNLRYESLLDIANKMVRSGEKTQASSTLKLAALEAQANAEALPEVALAMAKLGDQKQASTLFNQAIALQQQQTVETEPYFREKNLVNIIQKMAEAGQIESALNLTKRVSDQLRRAEVFNAIATQLIARGKLEEAQAPLSEALNIAQRISDEDSSYSYMSNGSCGNYKFEALSNIAQNLSLLGQLERALTVAISTNGCSSASGDEQRAYRVWAYSSILKPIKDPKLVQKAWQSAQTIHFSDWDRADVWGVVAIKLAEVHETSLAYDVAQKITKIEFFEGLRDPAYLGTKDELFKTIAVKLSEAGDVEKAQKLVPIIQPDGIEREAQAIILLKFIDQLDSKTQAQPIKALLSQALQLTQQTIVNHKEGFNDYGRQRNFRSELAASLTKNGQLPAALALAKTFQNPSDRSTILSRIALALAKKGSITDALRLVQTIKYPQIKDSALSDISSFLGKTGNISQALKTAQTIYSPPHRLSTLQDFIPQLKEKQQIDQILLIAQKTFTHSSIPQSQKNQIFIALARTSVAIRRPEEALQYVALLPEKTVEKAEAIAEIASTLILSDKAPTP